MNNTNLMDFEHIMNDLREAFESNKHVQNPSTRFNTSLLIAKNRNNNSILVNHKEVMGLISSTNIYLKSILSEKNISYEQAINSLNISDTDKLILKSFITDLEYLIPIGGNLPDPEAETQPNPEIVKSWKNVILILTIALSVGPGIQPFVDLIAINIEQEQNKIDNELRKEEIDLKRLELELKERELNIEEGKNNLPKKNNETFY